jgi:hypothetical protein
MRTRRRLSSHTLPTLDRLRELAALVKQRLHPAGMVHDQALEPLGGVLQIVQHLLEPAVP